MKKIIFIIDDEIDIQDIIEMNLKDEGYDVLFFSSAEDAVKGLAGKVPDLIILDIMMQGMDGYDFCRKLRSAGEHKNIPVIFLSAKSEEFDKVLALELGGDDYITKPIKPKVLMARVKALLKRRRGADNSQDVITAGDLVIDKEKIMVYKQDEDIRLPKMEFELLVLLASKPGKVFTREEIYNSLWGNKDLIVGDRTMDVHIRKLRESVGREYIRTIKGIGYRLEF